MSHLVMLASHRLFFTTAITPAAARCQFARQQGGFRCASRRSQMLQDFTGWDVLGCVGSIHAAFEGKHSSSLNLKRSINLHVNNNMSVVPDDMTELQLESACYRSPGVCMNIHGGHDDDNAAMPVMVCLDLPMAHMPWELVWQTCWSGETSYYRQAVLFTHYWASLQMLHLISFAGPGPVTCPLRTTVG